MRLRDMDLERIIARIDENIPDWHSMVELEEAYELWSWHPGMG
jgi:hypothetical protein